MNQRDKTRPERARAKQQRNDSASWRTYSLMLVCGLLLVAGFFLAGRQHFSSMDTGMKNSRLRKQVDELEAEKRRLLLAREVSLSPAEIKKAAKKTGLADQSAAEGEIAQIGPVTTDVTKDKVLPAAVSQTKPMIIKTAAIAPVTPATAAAFSKTAKLLSQVKKPSLAE